MTLRAGYKCSCGRTIEVVVQEYFEADHQSNEHYRDTLEEFSAWLQKESDMNNRAFTLNGDTATLQRDEELVNTIATLKRYKLTRLSSS